MNFGPDYRVYFFNNDLDDKLITMKIENGEFTAMSCCCQIVCSKLEKTKQKWLTSLSYFKFAYIRTSKHVEVRCPAGCSLAASIMLQRRSVVTCGPKHESRREPA